MQGGEVIALVLEILALLLVLYLAFFKSYFQEKGKNLATQEDVERITKLVEGVRTQLQFSLQAKLVLKREEHDALIAYYCQLCAWIESISSFSFSGIEYENLNEFDHRLESLDELHRATSMALAKVEILSNDQNFTTRGRELIVQVLQWQQPLLEKCGEYRLACIEAQKAMLEAQQSGKMEPYREALGRKQQIVAKQKSEMLPAYRELYGQVVQHRKSVSELLQSIVAEESSSGGDT